MKKIFLFSFLLLSTIIYSQDSNRKKDSIALFAPTGKGLPDGEAVSEMISKNGGRLFSSDKKVEIIIPEGALLSETKISIQPVTNLSVSGIGKTYRFEPSGLKFLIPAKLAFHYSDQDTTDGSPQLMSVSTQDAKGSWIRLSDVKVDAELKTVTGNINHFSEYTMSWTLVMWAHRNKVKVSNEIGVELYLTPINRPLDDASLKDILGAHKQWLGLQEQNPRIWSVNGILRGNSTVGKIIDIKDELNVIYNAPARVPVMNPIEIQIEIRGVELEGRFINVTRKCKVLVYDAVYEIKMESVMKSGGKGVWGGIRTATDEGSFYLSLDKQIPEILNIQNRLEKMKDDCKNQLLNPTTCTGLLHVAGSKEIKVTPQNAQNQPYPIVEIWFVPFPVEYSRVKFDCPSPNKRGGNSSGVNPVMRVGRALPYYLKFVAKDEEQIIIDSSKDSDDDGYLKIWVRKVKDD